MMMNTDNSNNNSNISNNEEY